MALSSAFSRMASGAAGFGAVGAMFDIHHNGMPGMGTLGMMAAGVGINLPSWNELSSGGLLTGRAGAIHNRKLWDSAKAGTMRAGGRVFGMGIAGMVGNAIGGPALGVAGAGAVMFPGAAKGVATWGFENAAGAIGLGGRAALGAAKGMTGRFGRGATGAVIGGMMGGLPGMGVGAAVGAMGRFKMGPVKGALKFMGRHPSMAAAGIGAVLAMPTIARGLMGMTAPNPVMMDIGMGSSAAVMGLDSNNAETLGLTLALHYRR